MALSRERHLETMDQGRAFLAAARAWIAPPEWDFASTLQIRVMPAKTGATISIHHEKMQSGEQRQAMHRHWSEVMDKLEALIKE